MRQLFTNLLIITLLLSSITKSHAQPAIEVYGNLPSVKSMALAPDGKRLAYISNSGGEEALLLFDLDKKEIIGGAKTGNIKSRYVSFAGPNYAILHVSKTLNPSEIRGKLEYSAAFAYNLKTKKIKQLLRNSDKLFPFQPGLGQIVGLHEDGKQVFMPAFTGTQDPVYSLMRVNLETGRAFIHKRGTEHTRDWLVDKDGTVLAREDYDNRKNVYTIRANQDGKLKVILRISDVKIPPLSLIGMKADRSALVITYNSEETNADLIAELSFDGEISEPIFQRKGADASVITDRNRFVIGSRYSGLYEDYEFFNDTLTNTMLQIQNNFAPAGVFFEDISNNYNKILARVEGTDKSPTYYLFTQSDNTISKIASGVEGLSNENMADVLTIEYKARDGVKIPSILTRPRNWREDQKYPTIILPHGGPELYDSVGYDWMAQYFASRGYIVLQPNFRGSDGLGTDFLLAGRGQWGRGVMQHDVTDGLNALIKIGWTDPKRVCIVGASYGGYAALAGGAFTPDKYACIGAIAPVADLTRMLIDEKKENGKDSWVLTYWSRLIGDPKGEREKLKKISPSEYANEFKAPVLLIHGRDDLIVPITQSNIMERALEKAGKDVTFIRLKGEDHYLSTGKTRLATLKALDSFVKKSIGEGLK